MGGPSGLGVSILSIAYSDCHLSTNCLVVRNFSVPWQFNLVTFLLLP